MIEIWNSSPGYFLAIAGFLFCTVALFVLAYLKNRPYRHEERMKAIEMNSIEQSFFSARLLTYIPWQFWTSFAILILVVLMAWITQGESETVFLELTKYVTGAVIGSLFGNTKQSIEPGA